MPKHVLLVSVAIAGLIAAAPAMARSELYQITGVYEATLTTVFGVNDHGVATGSWLDASGVEHGYVGSPNGSDYTTFDDPNEPGPGTEPRGISDAGYICGFSDSSNRSTASHVAWERNPGGTLTEVTKKGTVLNDLCQGLDSKQKFAASFVNASLQYEAYLGSNAMYSKGVKLKGITSAGVAARGVDDAGDVVGWYYDTSGIQNGFLIEGGTAQTIDVTGATYTTLESINNTGQLTGQYADRSGRIHGFIYTISTKAIKDIKVPGSSSFVQAWQINDKGQVAVGSDVGYYIYCPSSKDCSFGGKGASGGGAGQKPAQKFHRLPP